MAKAGKLSVKTKRSLIMDLNETVSKRIRAKQHELDSMIKMKPIFGAATIIYAAQSTSVMYKDSNGDLRVNAVKEAVDLFKKSLKAYKELD